MVTSLTPSGLPKSGLPQNGLPKMSAQSANRRLPFSSAATSTSANAQTSQPQKASPPAAGQNTASAGSQASSSAASNATLSAFASVNANASVHRTAPVRPAQASQAATFSQGTLSQGLTQDTPKFRTGTERALQQLESRYQAMFEGIQLKYFDPNKIENYIRMAEKRMGMELGEKERIRLVQISKSKDPNILKLLALELRIGIPKRLEQAALAALGELLLQRDDEDALQAYLDDQTKDDNLKAYVRTVMMMNKVERVMARVENAKSTLKTWFTIPGLNNQQGNQQQQKKKKQQPEQKKRQIR